MRKREREQRAKDNYTIETIETIEIIQVTC